jgi:hypothetical protein
MAAAPDSIPVNPNSPATIAMTRKIIDHFNILEIFKCERYQRYYKTMPSITHTQGDVGKNTDA